MVGAALTAYIAQSGGDVSQIPFESCPYRRCKTPFCCRRDLILNPVCVSMRCRYSMNFAVSSDFFLEEVYFSPTDEVIHEDQHVALTSGRLSRHWDSQIHVHDFQRRRLAFSAFREWRTVVSGASRTGWEVGVRFKLQTFKHIVTKRGFHITPI